MRPRVSEREHGHAAGFLLRSQLSEEWQLSPRHLDLHNICHKDMVFVIIIIIIIIIAIITITIIAIITILIILIAIYSIYSFFWLMRWASMPGSQPT